jgi:hypothetical protein
VGNVRVVCGDSDDSFLVVSRDALAGVLLLVSLPSCRDGLGVRAGFPLKLQSAAEFEPQPLTLVVTGSAGGAGRVAEEMRGESVGRAEGPEEGLDAVASLAAVTFFWAAIGDIVAVARFIRSSCSSSVGNVA